MWWWHRRHTVGQKWDRLAGHLAMDGVSRMGGGRWSEGGIVEGDWLFDGDLVRNGNREGGFNSQLAWDSKMKKRESRRKNEKSK